MNFLMAITKYRINLVGSEEFILKKLISRQTTAQNIAKRAKIIYLANGEGKTNKEIADYLHIHLCDVTRWTKRWIELSVMPVEERIADSPRSGAPDKITAEQCCQIFALACEVPEEHGRSITHWSHRELAEECIKQGIVKTISASHIGNLLKKRFTTTPKSLLAQC